MLPKRHVLSTILAASAVFCGAAPTTSHAGIYNMASILATEAEEGLTGAISGSADWRTGNVEYLFLSATPLARYRSDKHLLIGMMRGERKTSRGDTIISNTLEHVRYRYTFSERWLGEVFAQHIFDDVKRLNLRALFGVGPKATLVDGKDYGLDAGVAYMLEYEKLKADDAPDSGVTDLAHRNSTYLTGHYESGDRFQIAETLYLQPRLTGASDFRMLSQSQLTVHLTKRLSYTTSFTIAYDSRPPNTVEKLDTALQTSLTFEL